MGSEVKSGMTKLQIELMKEIFAHSWSRETSSDEAGWSSENPQWGHCAVAALVIQHLFGGELLRYDLAGTPFAAMRSHYKNRLPDGTITDFAAQQFQGGLPDNLPEPEIRKREEVLDPAKYPKTVERYNEFKKRAGEYVTLRLRAFARKIVDDAIRAQQEDGAAE